jgi:hypothetical protein
MATATQIPIAEPEDKGKEPLEQAKIAGVHAMEQAKEAVASVGEMAGQAVSAVGKKADELTASAGSGLGKWGDALSEKTAHEGVFGHASQAVAEKLKEGGHYLEEAKFTGLTSDVTKMIRKNPVPAVIVGFGIGFLLGRTMRS